MPRQNKSTRSKSRSYKMKGGHAGTVMPSEYFGGNSGRYFPVGSEELKGCSRQVAVSHGVVHDNGVMAGPVLAPKHGGSRRTNKSRMNKSRNNKSKSNRSRSNKSRTNKSRTNKSRMNKSKKSKK